MRRAGLVFGCWYPPGNGPVVHEQAHSGKGASQLVFKHVDQRNSHIHLHLLGEIGQQNRHVDQRVSHIHLHSFGEIGHQNPSHTNVKRLSKAAHSLSILGSYRAMVRLQ
jgi:hypothetical protein